MAVPRKRHTIRRRNNRRKAPSHQQAEPRQLAKCSNCNTKVLPHAVCYNCGFYKGRKILVKMAA
jgi:large subunit ribosomal protein L32